MMLLEAVRRFDLLTPGDRVLCALSGGADSVCLTHALCKNAGALGITVSAAHFTHGLRPEDAERERALCEALCRSLEIPLFCGEGDTAAYAVQNGVSCEEAARSLRYAFLRETAETWQADKIATGHQLEDNAETLLLNLIRGTGRAGLCGIPPVRENIIRPLLLTSRQETEDYCRENGLVFVTDPTNLGRDNVRARLRQEVFPVLRDINPQAPRHMAEAALELREDSVPGFDRASVLAEAARDTAEGIFLPVETLLSEPRETAVRTLQLVQRRLGGHMLSRAQLESVFLICAGDDPSARVSLPGTEAVRRYGELLLRIPGKADVPTDCILETFGACTFGPWEITVRPDGGEQDGLLLYAEAVFPLTVRSRREGDRIALPFGSRTVKKILIDRKIPKDWRDTVPILCHNNKILAVGGLCTAAGDAAVRPIRIICRRKEK